MGYLYIKQKTTMENINEGLNLPKQKLITLNLAQAYQIFQDFKIDNPQYSIDVETSDDVRMTITTMFAIIDVYWNLSLPNHLSVVVHVFDDEFEDYKEIASHSIPITDLETLPELILKTIDEYDRPTLQEGLNLPKMNKNTWEKPEIGDKFVCFNFPSVEDLKPHYNFPKYKSDFHVGGEYEIKDVRVDSNGDIYSYVVVNDSGTKHGISYPGVVNWFPGLAYPTLTRNMFYVVKKDKLNEGLNLKKVEIRGDYPDGAWEKHYRNDRGDMIKYEDSNGVVYEFDKYGNTVYQLRSNGDWACYEYDENDNQLYYERSDGFWEKHLYDHVGNVIYWEDSIEGVRINNVIPEDLNEGLNLTKTKPFEVDDIVYNIEPIETMTSTIPINKFGYVFSADINKVGVAFFIYNDLSIVTLDSNKIRSVDHLKLNSKIKTTQEFSIMKNSGIEILPIGTEGVVKDIGSQSNLIIVTNDGNKLSAFPDEIEAIK